MQLPLSCCTENLVLLAVAVPFAVTALFPLLSSTLAASEALAISFCVAAPYVTLFLLALALPSALERPLTFSVGSTMTNLSAPLAFRVDAISMLLAILTSLVGALSLTFNTLYLSPHNRAYAVQRRNLTYPLALLTIGSLLGLYFSDDLLLLLIFWELAAICTYALIIFRTDHPDSSRAGLKAILMTHVGGVSLLVAALLLYVQTGSLSLAGYESHGGLGSGAFKAFAALALVAALPKAEQYPLYTWFIDGTIAPSTSIVLFSVCGFQASVLLLARFLTPLYRNPPAWEPVRLAATTLGALTALAGGVGGLIEGNLKRAIAYGKVAGMGFILMSFGLLTPRALAATLTLTVSHALTFSLLFLGAGSVVYTVGDEDLKRLGGLYQRMKLTALSFLVGCLTLASVPSTPEFIGKFLLFQASLEAGYQHLLPVIVLGSLLNAAIGARLFYSVYLGGERRDPRIGDPPAPMLAPLLALTAATMLVGTYPKPLLEGWVLAALSQLGVGTAGDLYEQLYEFAGALISIVAVLVALTLAAALAAAIMSEEASVEDRGEAEEEAAKPFLCGVDVPYAPLPGDRVYSRFLSAVKLGGLTQSIDPDRFYVRLAKAFLGLTRRALLLDIHYSYRASVLTFLAAAFTLLVVAGVLACL